MDSVALIKMCEQGKAKMIYRIRLVDSMLYVEDGSSVPGRIFGRAVKNPMDPLLPWFMIFARKGDEEKAKRLFIEAIEEDLDALRKILDLRMRQLDVLKAFFEEPGLYCGKWDLGKLCERKDGK